ncbi:MAG: ABC transporter permease [Bacteroidia bacterium]|nr:ABC transporter permease [Bacteroidia bacterium]
MGYYFLKRLFLFVPVLLVLALLSFWLTRNTPGDPVLRSLSKEGLRMGNDPLSGPEVYIRKWQELGLNRPIFYCAVFAPHEPDSLFAIPFPQDKEWVQDLSAATGNPECWQALYFSLLSAERQMFQMPSDSSRTLILTRLRELRSEPPQQVGDAIIRLKAQFPAYPLNQIALPAGMEQPGWYSLMPRFRWYGSNNAFHEWLKRVVRMDLGLSYRDGRPVASHLPTALLWTFLVNFLSLLLALVVSIPAGVYSARAYGSSGERLLNGLLFILYSIPAFWLATLLLVFFASGTFLDWFPAGGIADIRSQDNWPWYRKLADWSWHLVLPTFAYAYSAFAFLTGQVRNAMLENIQADFIRTARAKGLPEKIVIWKHALRNSLLPLITLVAQIIPGLVGGSIILETIFSIPGMGLLTWQAVSMRDYPVLIAVFMLSGLLTLTGVLVADFLYRIADPRIRLEKS